MSAQSPRDPRAPKFPVIIKDPAFNEVTGNFSATDYFQWAALGGASFPLGYVLGAKLDRSMRRPSMWWTGLLGTLGGFLLAYQNSSLRLQGFGRNDAEVKRYIKED